MRGTNEMEGEAESATSAMEEAHFASQGNIINRKNENDILHPSLASTEEAKDSEDIIHSNIYDDNEVASISSGSLCSPASDSNETERMESENRVLQKRLSMIQILVQQNQLLREKLNLSTTECIKMQGNIEENKHEIEELSKIYTSIADENSQLKHLSLELEAKQKLHMCCLTLDQQVSTLDYVSLQNAVTAHLGQVFGQKIQSRLFLNDLNSDLPRAGIAALVADSGLIVNTFPSQNHKYFDSSVDMLNSAVLCVPLLKHENSTIIGSVSLIDPNRSDAFDELEQSNLVFACSRISLVDYVFSRYSRVENEMVALKDESSLKHENQSKKISAMSKENAERTIFGSLFSAGIFSSILKCTCREDLCNVVSNHIESIILFAQKLNVVEKEIKNFKVLFEIDESRASTELETIWNLPIHNSDTKQVASLRIVLESKPDTIPRKLFADELKDVISVFCQFLSVYLEKYLQAEGLERENKSIEKENSDTTFLINEKNQLLNEKETNVNTLKDTIKILPTLLMSILEESLDDSPKMVVKKLEYLLRRSLLFDRMAFYVSNKIGKVNLLNVGSGGDHESTITTSLKLAQLSFMSGEKVNAASLKLLPDIPVSYPTNVIFLPVKHGDMSHGVLQLVRADTPFTAIDEDILNSLCSLIAVIFQIIEVHQGANQKKNNEIEELKAMSELNQNNLTGVTSKLVSISEELNQRNHVYNLLLKFLNFYSVLSDISTEQNVKVMLQNLSNSLMDILEADFVVTSYENIVIRVSKTNSQVRSTVQNEKIIRIPIRSTSKAENNKGLDEIDKGSVELIYLSDNIQLKSEILQTFGTYISKYIESWNKIGSISSRVNDYRGRNAELLTKSQDLEHELKCVTENLELFEKSKKAIQKICAVCDWAQLAEVMNSFGKVYIYGDEGNVKTVAELKDGGGLTELSYDHPTSLALQTGDDQAVTFIENSQAILKIKNNEKAIGAIIFDHSPPDLGDCTRKLWLEFFGPVVGNVVARLQNFETTSTEKSHRLSLETKLELLNDLSQEMSLIEDYAAFEKIVISTLLQAFEGQETYEKIGVKIKLRNQLEEGPIGNLRKLSESVSFKCSKDDRFLAVPISANTPGKLAEENMGIIFIIFGDWDPFNHHDQGVGLQRFLDQTLINNQTLVFMQIVAFLFYQWLVQQQEKQNFRKSEEYLKKTCEENNEKAENTQFQLTQQANKTKEASVLADALFNLISILEDKNTTTSLFKAEVEKQTRRIVHCKGVDLIISPSDECALKSLGTDDILDKNIKKVTLNETTLWHENDLYLPIMAPNDCCDRPKNAIGVLIVYTVEGNTNLESKLRKFSDCVGVIAFHIRQRSGLYSQAETHRLEQRSLESKNNEREKMLNKLSLLLEQRNRVLDSYDLLWSLLQCPTLQDIINESTSILRKMLDSDAAYLFIYDETAQQLAFLNENNTVRLNLTDNKGVLASAVASKLVITIQNTKEDKRFIPDKDGIFESRIRIKSCMCVPVYNSDALLGVFQIVNSQERSFTQQDEEDALYLCGKIAMLISQFYSLSQVEREKNEAIEKSKSIYESFKNGEKKSLVAERTYRFQQSISGIKDSIISCPDSKSVIQVVRSYFPQVFKCQCAGLFFLTSGGKPYTLCKDFGDKYRFFENNRGLVVNALKIQKPINIPWNAQEDTRFDVLIDKYEMMAPNSQSSKPCLNSALCIPFLVTESTCAVIQLINKHQKDKSGFSHDEQDQLVELADCIAKRLLMFAKISESQRKEKTVGEELKTTQQKICQSLDIIKKNVAQIEELKHEVEWSRTAIQLGACLSSKGAAGLNIVAQEVSLFIKSLFCSFHVSIYLADLKAKSAIDLLAKGSKFKMDGKGIVAYFSRKCSKRGIFSIPILSKHEKFSISTDVLPAGLSASECSAVFIVLPQPRSENDEEKGKGRSHKIILRVLGRAKQQFSDQQLRRMEIVSELLSTSLFSALALRTDQLRYDDTAANLINEENKSRELRRRLDGTKQALEQHVFKSCLREGLNKLFIELACLDMSSSFNNQSSVVHRILPKLIPGVCSAYLYLPRTETKYRCYVTHNNTQYEGSDSVNYSLATCQPVKSCSPAIITDPIMKCVHSQSLCLPVHIENEKFGVLELLGEKFTKGLGFDGNEQGEEYHALQIVATYLASMLRQRKAIFALKKKCSRNSEQLQNRIKAQDKELAQVNLDLRKGTESIEDPFCQENEVALTNEKEKQLEKRVYEAESKCETLLQTNNHLSERIRELEQENERLRNETSKGQIKEDTSKMELINEILKMEKLENIQGLRFREHDI